MPEELITTISRMFWSSYQDYKTTALLQWWTKITAVGYVSTGHKPLYWRLSHTANSEGLYFPFLSPVLNKTNKTMVIRSLSSIQWMIFVNMLPTLTTENKQGRKRRRKEACSWCSVSGTGLLLSQFHDDRRLLGIKMREGKMGQRRQIHMGKWFKGNKETINQITKRWKNTGGWRKDKSYKNPKYHSKGSLKESSPAPGSWSANNRVVFLNTVILLLSWAGIVSLMLPHRPVPAASQFHFALTPSLWEQTLVLVCVPPGWILNRTVSIVPGKYAWAYAWLSTQTHSLLTLCSHSTVSTSWLKPPSWWPLLASKERLPPSCGKRRWRATESTGLSMAHAWGEEEASNCVEQEEEKDRGIKDTR